MSNLALLDAAGRRRSPATLAFIAAARRATRVCGRDHADPPAIEEIVGVMRVAGTTTHGLRTRALVVVLWRAGLRISRRWLSRRATWTDRAAASLSAAARAARVARSGWTDGRGSRSTRGSRLDSRCPSVRCCVSSTARQRGGRGHRPRLDRPGACSPSVPACAGASRHISSDTPTPSRWRAKVCRSTSSSDNWATRTSVVRPSTCKASTTARSSRRSAPERRRCCRQARDSASGRRAKR